MSDRPRVPVTTWTDDVLADLLAEVDRLRAQVEDWREVLALTGRTVNAPFGTVVAIRDALARWPEEVTDE